MIVDFNTNERQLEALKLVQDGNHTMILFGGAIRGGKTFWGLSTLLILCKVFPKSRWCVVRESMEKIRTTTIPSFMRIEPSGNLKRSPFEYTHPNGSVIMFKSENFANDKELNWMRGLEVNGFLFEELNEMQFQTFNKAFERSGSWKVEPNMPLPYILATCNPTNGWVKTEIYEKHKSGTLNPKWRYVQSKITDNEANLDPVYIESLKQLPFYEYEVFVNGNWDLQIKRGGEFWKAFELDSNVKPAFYSKAPVHISIDENVNPYLSCSMWQVQSNCATQIQEFAMRNPKNTVRDLCTSIVNYLKSVDHKDVVYIYGDRTSLKEDTKLEKGVNFFSIIRSYISEHYETAMRLPTSNPSVTMSGAFINACYEYNFSDIKITIGEHCKLSINDYIESKEASDGTILKEKTKDPLTNVTYEKNGHFSDAKRYFLTKCFESAYLKFQEKPTKFSPTIHIKQNNKKR